MNVESSKFRKPVFQEKIFANVRPKIKGRVWNLKGKLCEEGKIVCNSKWAYDNG